MYETSQGELQGQLVESWDVAEDGTSVTWKLKKGVTWHDGKPFTADDYIFNWEYAADPATAATTIGSYKDCKVVKLDSHTIRVEFAKPTPYWADPFVGVVGMMIVLGGLGRRRRSTQS